MMWMLSGFIAVYFTTLYDRREGMWFSLKMVVFVIYECCVVLMFAFHYVKGIHMKYGP